MKIRHVAAVVAAVLLLPLAIVHGVLRASLPQLDGDVPRMGIVAPVVIERDARGVPTILAGNRVDLAYGTGFAHGQDRFFQMDLLRRLAAGELSEIFGEAALEQDQKARLFRFRHVARESLAQATPEQRAVLEAYARGVNAALADLGSRPWEYWLLRTQPVPWKAEDTMLVTFAMWWDLQYSDIETEIVRREVNARLGGAQCESGWKCGLAFLYPARTAWDAPNSASGVINPGAGAAADSSAASAVPPPEVLDVRGTAAAASVARVGPIAASPHADIGSNNWAVAGRLTATGAALVANDMHLNQRVPPTWYRARLRLAASMTQPGLDLSGVTLPGAPLLVAGSNGHIAWGFTNSAGGWNHVQPVSCSGVGERELRMPEGAIALSVQQETIHVRDRPDVPLAVKSGPAGLLYEADPSRGVCWFVTWLAQLPAATNMNLMALERAVTVSEALAAAPAIGIPHENLVVGDRDGHIGWAIAGRVPVTRNASRADGSSAWTRAESHPRLLDPEIGRIWTANALATADESEEAAIGGEDASVGADYDLGARAHQVRDDLLALRGPATAADMLRIQLDDRAVFLARWRALLLDLIDTESLTEHPQRAQFRGLVADWNARASVDSVGYRLVRAFHDRTQQVVWETILAALKIAPDRDVPAHFEPALWRLVNERPLHMLAANYSSWKQFLLVQVDGTIAELQEACGNLSRCTWGAHRPVRIRHPLSRALPELARFLDMPTVELPGDHDMPRVQDGSTGASERFAVSPGHEAQGYLELPGGQSGHPLSPYYRAGFMDWARGTAVPFLPGPPRHRLTLRPE